ncbi:MAG: hypothetical protein M3O25_11315 [Actinomycetota bacterium]|nr:hypothetical protein [Actinomycetota bacterium]
MLVFFSGRHLKPGHWEQFREAWDPSDEEREGFPEGTVIYHARSVKDEDEVISFGLFDVGRDSIPVIRGGEETELKRQEALGRHVKDVPLEGIYEVVEEIRP